MVICTISHRAVCGVSLHKVHNKTLPYDLRKWSIILLMGKSFPKDARICSEHFTDNDFLSALNSFNSIVVLRAFIVRIYFYTNTLHCTDPTSERRHLKCTACPSKNLPIRPSDKRKSVSLAVKEQRRLREE